MKKHNNQIQMPILNKYRSVLKGIEHMAQKSEDRLK